MEVAVPVAAQVEVQAAAQVEAQAAGVEQPILHLIIQVAPLEQAEEPNCQGDGLLLSWEASGFWGTSLTRALKKLKKNERKELLASLTTTKQSMVFLRQLIRF